MIWPAIIGAVGAIGGGLLSAKGAKDAGEEASAGSLAEIEYNRETRDLIRKDQHPYRQAGYAALNALMSMTGLPNSDLWYGGGSKTPEAPTAWRSGWDVDEPQRMDAGGRGISSYRRIIRPNYAGGPMDPRTDYNVSELGPENVFTKGRVTRPQRPVTIDGQTGYVEPNIEGRYTGGSMDEEGVLGGMKIGAPGTEGYGTPSTLPPKGPVGPSQPPPQTGVDPNTGYPIENPGGTEGGYNFMTDPGYAFRFKEGMRALDRGAAAKGGLLSGGYARKAIRYGQDYASGEYTNVYNRIANIAGLGQTANQTNANAALYTGANMGTAAAQAGYARASGYAGAGNAWANAANQIAQLPWGSQGSAPQPTQTYAPSGNVPDWFRAGSTP